MFARHRNQEPDLVQEQESPTADSEAGDEHMPSFEVKHDSRLSRGISRARAYAAARPKRHFVGAFAVLLGVVILLLPSPYVIEMPGPTQDVLGKVEDGAVIDITGTGVTTYKDSGKLLLVTVNASGVPGYPVTNAQALLAWANPKATVIPQEAVFPVGQSAKDYAKESNKEMSSSQNAAATAAKRFLKAHGYDVSGMKVSMHVDDIGGPSAGMMYTLGLIDKVTGEQLSGGKTIAGTGTMNAKGKVGAIGGIRLKMIGAKRDGATWFLAPESNCSDVVGHVPQGLHVVKVGTLDEAYDALVAIRDGKGGSLPQCTVKQ